MTKFVHFYLAKAAFSTQIELSLCINLNSS